MKQFRMGDVPWNLGEADIATLYPELEPKDRAEAAENQSWYFKAIGKIYDRLEDEGNLEDTLLRIQYEKRNDKNTASQNEIEENDETPTSTWDSNEFTS